MSAELAGEAPVEPRDRTSRLNRWVTGAALGVLAGLAALVFWPAHGLDTLERPEESLERVVTRDMDFRAAARTAPRWERRLLALAFSSDAGARADAIAWYEELARVEGSPLAELYRIILLAEDGQTEAAESVTTAWAPTDDAARRLAAWARAAYEAEVPAPEELRAAIEAVRRELPPGWFADRLVIRLASRLGDAALVAERERAIQARGAPLLWRLRAILVGETLLVLVGLVALVAWLVGPAVARPASRWRRSRRRGPPSTGWGSLRAAPWASSAWPSCGRSCRTARGPPCSCRCSRRSPSAATSSGTAADRGGPSRTRSGSASAVGVAHAPAGDARTRGRVDARRRADRPRRGAPRRGDALDRRLPGAARVGHARRRWWPTRSTAASSRRSWRSRSSAACSTRPSGSRLGPAPATLVSAALFALAHGYGVVGFVSVFVSGVLWALAYERTRSLLPGMLAHAVSNIQATTIVLATLRF